MAKKISKKDCQKTDLKIDKEKTTKRKKDVFGFIGDKLSNLS